MNTLLGWGDFEVMPGFKQTEIGTIPDDWDVRLCSDLSDRIMVGIVIRPTQYYVRDGIPAYRSANIRESGISDIDLVFISEKSNALLAKSQTRSGDVLTVRTGYPGTSAVVRPHQAGSNCIDILITRPKATILDSSYLAIWVNSPLGKEQVIRTQGGLAQQHFNVGDMKNLIIALPSIAEQRSIATALNDVDVLLGALDRLIAKKRDLKQAAMQQLLTGQTRLPGFDSQWEVKPLASLGVLIKGSGVKKDEATSGDLPCVRYGEIYTHHHDVVRVFNSFVSPSVASSATLLRKGDVLFAGSGETKEEIGKAVAFVHDCIAYAGGDIVILRPAYADSVFLGYYLNSRSIQRQKASLGQGDAVVHISAASLAAIELVVPPLPEQTAIAAVLSDMDAELAALEQRRRKTQALKQAMMQELLTGRTRLV
ncbi:MAG: restriction endonuclease subunit S [Proteobacteria bacterium]|nr:restriction endonuclease subunit S [Pseudomonadota bacterium]